MKIRVAEESDNMTDENLSVELNKRLFFLEWPILQIKSLYDMSTDNYVIYWNSMLSIS